MLVRRAEQSHKNSLNDVDELRGGETLCVGRMQSFHGLANFNNLNAHATSNLYAGEEVK